MYTHRIINKVPGHIPAEPKKEKQGYLGDLSERTVPQLNELLDRQLKLLANKSFIDKLADKGEKLTKLKESIEEELKKCNDSENLSRMLLALSINGKEDMDTLEWTGRCAPGHVVVEEDSISDEETDPFKILATHSGAGFHKKKHRIIKPPEPLIKPSDLEVEENCKSKDLEENKLSDNEDEGLDEYAKHLCEKLDSMKTTNQTKFLPHKTLKSCTNEKRDGEFKKAKGKWEVTAATPPPSVHGDAKMVSLQESIRLQCEQQQNLKEVHMRHAAERLAATASGHSLAIGRAPQHGNYRDPTSGTSSEDEGSEHEVHDEEEPDGGGVVIYNLVDDPENS